MKMFVLVLLVVLFPPAAQASDVHVDMQKIKMIESSGNPRAYNVHSQARGLYQITPIVLEEWNNFHPGDQYTEEDLFSSRVNSTIAHWYMNYRIPQMLKYYGIQDTVTNRLIAYNAGIAYVVGNGKVLPRETVHYIEKYNK